MSLKNRVDDNLRSLLDDFRRLGMSDEATIRFLELFEAWLREELAKEKRYRLKIIEGGKREKT